MSTNVNNNGRCRQCWDSIEQFHHDQWGHEVTSFEDTGNTDVPCQFHVSLEREVNEVNQRLERERREDD